MKRILVANRGEIARRIIHTAHAMGIETVAVFSDADAGELHVREATFSYALGGHTSAESYLRIDKMLVAASATGADAVHPGYGFLSENAGFAQAVQDAGLIWIGPPPAAILALGSKSQAKVLARRSQVPCLPGYEGTEQDDELLAIESERIGYPVMIKAVAGGGGRGMRLVSRAGDFAEALHSARSEALAGFGDERVLIERALLAPRHVEVQVFADQHGACIHLGERDCSVQRRHQKIIEESPSPAIDASMRERMGQCAVDLALAAGYVGAGTVEFLIEGGEFFLMEMNTRLQVEHPVTEALTGQDLVAWQIRIARGEPLPWTQEQVRMCGHAIEVRLCAEDEHFAPRTGRMLEVLLPPAIAFATAPFDGAKSVLRIDGAIEQGMAVTPYYDSMLGKLIVHAANRDIAIGALRAALLGTRILGVHTNRAFLAACLDHPIFRSGQALVPFLEGAADELRGQLHEQDDKALLPAVAAITLRCEAQSAHNETLQCAFARPVRMLHREEMLEVSLHMDRSGAAHLLPASTSCGHVEQAVWRTDSTENSLAACTLRPVPDATGLVRQTAPYVRQLRCAQETGTLMALHAVAVQQGARARWHVQTDDGIELWLDDLSLAPERLGGQGSLKTELRAPFNGRVIRLGAESGARLAAGEQAVVIESMKLEHSLDTPAAVQVVEILVAEGQQVRPGQLLMRFGPAAGAVEAKV